MSKRFEQILSEMLTDYQNQISGVSVDKGSLVRIKSAVLAAALDGLYRYLDAVADFLPDRCDTERLYRWAALLDVPTMDLELDEPLTESQLRENVLSALKHPPAGGNRYDWRRWVDDVAPTVKYAVHEWLRGVGSVDIVLEPDTQQETADAVAVAIDASRPVGIADVRITIAESETVDLTIEYSGVISETDLRARVVALFDRLLPGDSLHRSRVEALAIESGATSAEMTSAQMADDTVPGMSEAAETIYQLELGTLTITRV